MASPLIVSLKKQKNFCGSKIELLSPAKINLYLNVIGEYPGGFHRLESIVERISLFDKVTIDVKKEPSVRITSNRKDLETNQNLCVKAILLLKKNFQIPFGFDVSLEKNIPVGSGLGGGSSNAAVTLLGINKILDLKLNINKLYRLGAKLGSDVNFFLADSQFAFLQGKGEKVRPLSVNHKFSHFVIWPGVYVSTKKVYKNTRVKLTKFFNNVNILRYALRKRDDFLIKKSIYNILEKKAFSICSELEKVKEYLNRKGIFCRLTGSGGAFYTSPVCLGHKDNNLSIIKLRNIVPDNWDVFEIQTF